MPEAFLVIKYALPAEFWQKGQKMAYFAVFGDFQLNRGSLENFLKSYRSRSNGELNFLEKLIILKNGWRC